MKRSAVILLFINFFLNVSIFANDENWQNKWRDRALVEISELRDFSDNNHALKIFGYAALAQSTNIKYMSQNRLDVLYSAANKIKSMPSHADFFKNHIAHLREENAKKKSINYDFDRYRMFASLHYIKSVEVVEMLIEFLDDNQDFEVISGPGVYYESEGNDSKAAGALMMLINDLPLEKDRWGYYRKDIPALQVWGREVLEGKRTFRFKDEPGVYNIHGRIREERREPSLPPLPAASGQDGMAGEKDASSPGVRWATLAALFVLLAVAARVFFFSRRSA